MQQIENGRSFPTFRGPTAAHGEMSVPDDLRGDWNVVLFYRGHW